MDPYQFTVVCFGDVIAQNALETVLADITSVIGWMCIAQVTGQISSLMAVLDKVMAQLLHRRYNQDALVIANVLWLLGCPRT